MLPFIKKSLSAGLHVAKSHALKIALVLGLGWYFWPQDSLTVFPQPRYEISHNQSFLAESAVMDFAANSPVMARSNMAKMARRDIMPDVVADGFAPEETETKVIRSGNLTLETASPKETKTLIEKELTTKKGVITNMNSWEVRPGVLGFNLTLRIPSEVLDETLEALEKLGRVKNLSLNTQDITAQYADTANQIKNLETRRKRVRKLLEFETKNLSDILQVDRELTNVQNQLDNLTRTQKRRDRDVSYSTIRLTLSPEPQIGDTKNPYWSPKNSWRSAVNDLILTLQKLTDKAIRLLVFSPLWLPVIGIIWWWRRRK